jgi:LmbE family N-acetylglucosaminyl deacetylase
MEPNRVVAALPDDWRRALCVAAHPDDLEYGTAAAVASWTSRGKEVSYLLATRGEAGIAGLPPDRAGPLREKEQRAAARAVGVEEVEFLDHADGVVAHGLPLRRDLARLIRRARPEVVVSVAFTDRMIGGLVNQADHRAVGLATLDAARDAGNRWVFPELLEEGLEPWSGVRHVCLAGAPAPTHGVDVTGFVDHGVASLRAHRTYTDAVYGPDFDAAAFVGWFAARAGAMLGVAAGALFEVFTLVPDGPPPWDRHGDR